MEVPNCAGHDLSAAVVLDRNTPSVASPSCCEGKVSASRNAPPNTNSPIQGRWRAAVAIVSSAGVY